MSLPPLPESFPAGYIAQTEYFYTADQLKAYGQACREQALEEAATICDSLGGDIHYNNPDETRLCANSLAHAIRGLK